MCKSVKRPELIKEYFLKKKEMDKAGAELKVLGKELLSNMSRAGVSKDTIEYEEFVVTATAVVSTCVDIERCQENPQWCDLEAQEKELSEERKEIEKDYRKEKDP